MKNKIAIITLHSVKNYGSVLQAYATQCYFKALGLDAIIIDFRRPWETNTGYWFYLTDKSIKSIARNILYFPSKIIQCLKFDKFKKKYLKTTTNTYVSLKDFKNNPVDADFFCSGSDQVWNSGWNCGVIPEYFLNFAPNGVKKISFASSFGNSKIDANDKKIIKTLLCDYDLITVREAPSVKMLHDEFNLDSYEILDPTLQMNGDFWKEICRSERKIKGNYVLLIQLNRNHKFDEYAKSFCKEKKMRLVRLCLRVDQIVLPGKSVVIPEVNDYIRLIRDAEYVLTDSFHAVSFCLNLEKQFYVYYPEKYAERINSILTILQLTDRELIHHDYDKIIDYRIVNNILNDKRRFAEKLMLEVFNDGK